MADVSFTVEAKLQLTGEKELKSGLETAAAATKSLFSNMKGLAGSVAELATQAFQSFSSISSAAIASGLSIASASAQSIGNDLRALETRSVQLASVVGSAMQVPFSAAQQESEKLFAQFSKDAAESGGELSDFITVATLLASPLLQAGQSMSALHDLTKLTVAGADAAGESYEQAGKQISQMLNGTASDEQSLFQLLGSLGKASSFNALSTTGRFDKLKDALSSPNISATQDAAGATMDGRLSTLTAHLNNLGRVLGSPIYEVAQRHLGAFVELLGEAANPSSKFTASLAVLGETIAVHLNAFLSIFSRLFPQISGQAESLLNQITPIVDQGLSQIVKFTNYLVQQWPFLVTTAKDIAKWMSVTTERAGELLKSIGGGDIAKGVERLADIYLGGSILKAIGPGIQEFTTSSFTWGKTVFNLISDSLLKTCKEGGAELEKSLESASLSAMTVLTAGAKEIRAASAAATASESILAASAAAAGAGELTAGATAGIAVAGGTTAVGASEIAAGTIAGSTTTVGATEIAMGTAATAGSAAASEAVVLVLAIAAAVYAFTVALEASNFASTAFSEEIDHFTKTIKSIGKNIIGIITAIWDVIVSLKPLFAILGSYLMIILTAIIFVIDIIATAIDGLLMAAKFIIKTVAEIIDWILTRLRLDKLVGIDRSVKMDNEPEERKEYKISENLWGDIVPNTRPSYKQADFQPPKSNAQKVEVTVKWDLGEGDDDAIFVRTRRHITEMTRQATASVRGGRIPGMF